MSRRQPTRALAARTRVIARLLTLLLLVSQMGLAAAGSGAGYPGP